MKKITLSETISIPILGFGTWKMQGQTCQNAVRSALELGYRHIDTADAYGNHSDVAKGIAASGIEREKLFITTKVFNDDHERQDVLSVTKRFLTELNTDYIDLLLIHWPVKDIPVSETLSAMQELKESGVVKSIGVSNFTAHHIEDALKSGVDIVNNQIEVHPQFNQVELRTFCAEKNISVTAYSPLAQGEALKIPLIQELAKKYQATPAQIVINWMTTNNLITIPKSETPERIQENLQALELELEADDIQQIDNLPQKNRLVNPSFGEFDY